MWVCEAGIPHNESQNKSETLKFFFWVILLLSILDFSQILSLNLSIAFLTILWYMLHFLN